jgi:limonene 1,2-monooxygenase
MRKQLDFGLFIAPYHRIGENPVLALERDLELVEFCDRLGFDEAWIGEHHSGGWEIIPDPMLFIATAAGRTRTIRLGTGVVSLPYHHPLMVADRVVQLDYTTRGRMMLGVGPGALIHDALMMGIDPMTQRAHMDEALGAIIDLLEGNVVNHVSDSFKLLGAQLQMLPAFGRIPMAVASTASPSGMTTAGKHGVGVLSLGAGLAGGKKNLAEHWQIGQESAEKHGKDLRREEWRIVLRVHLADSREEALNDVREGRLYERKHYFRWGDRDETLEDEIAAGSVIVGTPDDMISALRQLQDETGGFGGFLILAHDWTTRAKTLQSYELIARHVIPEFKGLIDPVRRAWEAMVERGKNDRTGNLIDVLAKAYQDAGKQMPEDTSLRNLR